jgi:hypothetical protein
VLFERLTHPSNVLAAGYFVSRSESIKEIVDLNDQHGYIEKTRRCPRMDPGQRARCSLRYRLWGTGRKAEDRKNLKTLPVLDPINPQPGV